MLPSGLITFRETLEAALVIGIVLSFLSKTNQTKFKRFVFVGIGAGIVIAALLAISLEVFFGGLSGKTEEIFEGILMFVTAGFLTWMILWVHRQKDVVKKIKQKMATHVDKGYGIGILLLVASAVIREGTETVLYLRATSMSGFNNQLIGALLGVLVALFVGYMIFAWAIRVNLSKVFTATSIFLLLFAAGLVAHGVHEFQEAGIVPVFSFDPIINISGILDHKSDFGSILRTLFGYTSKPTLLELVSYTSFIAFILWLEKAATKAISRKTMDLHTSDV